MIHLHQCLPITLTVSHLWHLRGALHRDQKAGRKGAAAAVRLPRGCLPGGRTWADAWRWWTCPQWLWRTAAPQGQTSGCSWWGPGTHRRRPRRSPLPAAAGLRETEHKQPALSWIHRVMGSNAQWLHRKGWRTWKACCKGNDPLQWQWQFFAF